MRKAWNMLKRLHADQDGAVGIEKILIIALVVLPLLIFLIWFKDDIGEFVTEKWEDLKW